LYFINTYFFFDIPKNHLMNVLKFVLLFKTSVKVWFFIQMAFWPEKSAILFSQKKNSSFNKVFVFMQTVTNCNFLAELLKSNNNFRHKEIFPWLIKFLCWKNEMFRVFLWSMKKKNMSCKKKILWVICLMMQSLNGALFFQIYCL